MENNSVINETLTFKNAAPKNIVHMSEYAISDKDIATFGVGPCVSILGYNPNTKKKLLIHSTDMNVFNNSETPYSSGCSISRAIAELSEFEEQEGIQFWIASTSKDELTRREKEMKEDWASKNVKSFLIKNPFDIAIDDSGKPFLYHYDYKKYPDKYTNDELEYLAYSEKLKKIKF